MYDRLVAPRARSDLSASTVDLTSPSFSDDYRYTAKDKTCTQDTKPFMISFTYVSADSTRHWQREYWPDVYTIRNVYVRNPPWDSRPGAKGVDMYTRRFYIEWASKPNGTSADSASGSFSWNGAKAGGAVPDLVCWNLDTDEYAFHAMTIEWRGGRTLQGRGRVPWQDGVGDSTPAGILARTPLPIQWHVHSLDSTCRYSLRTKRNSDTWDLLGDDIKQEGEEVHPLDSGEAKIANVHIEKNWALTFPESYIWVQARDHEKGEGVCLAGGTLFKGVQAYLVGYHGNVSDRICLNRLINLFFDFDAVVVIPTGPMLTAAINQLLSAHVFIPIRALARSPPAHILSG